MLGDEKIQCLMYADDLVLMSLSAQGPQQQLDSLNEYCKKWELCVNIKKTKVVSIFGQGKSKEKMHPFYLDGRCLEIVSCYCNNPGVLVAPVWLSHVCLTGFEVL